MILGLDITHIAWVIPVFPLVMFPFILLLGRKLWNGGAPLAILAGGSSLVMSILVLIDLSTGSADPYESSMPWITFNDFTWDVGMLIDNLTALMLFIVSLVGFLVIVYSVGYMKGDDALPRYYAEISLFIGVMLGLIISDNLLQLFIFWELVGVCSYLLIGFWYKKPEAASAAKKAFLVTRLGDIMLLVGIIVIFNTFHSFKFTELEQQVDGFADLQLLTLITLLLFGGAVGKSAQFPLHVWLPDAMEGPTTVSALIHAATMVKAGVFLVARSYFMFTETSLDVVACIGAITAFMAASMALVVFDIKRVLAYSTISQLGYMMLALGTGREAGGYTAGMFHLMNHAFFKALLFLCSGSVIHAMHTNDMRKMGGLRKKMPITAIAMLIGSLSITGMPFLSGFFSKDDIFVAAEHATRFEIGGFNPIWFLAVIAAIFTSFYMFRLWFMTFVGKPRSKAAKMAHESPYSMTIPLMLLAGFAIFSGYLGASWLGIDRFQNFIFFEHAHEFQFELVPFLETFSISLAVFFFGLGMAYLLYIKRSIKPWIIIKRAHLVPIYKLLLNKYYMDYSEKDILEGKGFYGGYRGPFIGISLWFWRSGSEVFDWFDRNIIDGVVNGIAWISTHSGKTLRKLQTGVVNNYAALVVVGLCLLILVSFWHDMMVLIWDTMGGN